jgi:hypothetical protein
MAAGRLVVGYFGERKTMVAGAVAVSVVAHGKVELREWLCD